MHDYFHTGTTLCKVAQRNITDVKQKLVDRFLIVKSARVLHFQTLLLRQQSPQPAAWTVCVYSPSVWGYSW